jgi:hypothetical protein
VFIGTLFKNSTNILPVEGVDFEHYFTPDNAGVFQINI